MGGGEFPEWDLVAVDIATMPLINKQLETAVAALGGGFSLNMGQIIGWEDLKGIHGLGTGNKKALKVPWTWLEWQIFFIFWSFKLAGKDIFSWEKSPLPCNQQEKTLHPPQKNKNKEEKVEKSKTKFQCTEKQKQEGYNKGVERAKSRKRTIEVGADKSIELALALSISEAQVLKNVLM